MQCEGIESPLSFCLRDSAGFPALHLRHSLKSSPEFSPPPVSGRSRRFHRKCVMAIMSITCRQCKVFREMLTLVGYSFTHMPWSCGHIKSGIAYPVICTYKWCPGNNDEFVPLNTAVRRSISRMQEMRRRGFVSKSLNLQQARKRTLGFPGLGALLGRPR